MGKKGKAPALATEPEELKHLGVCVNDLIQTCPGEEAFGVDVSAYGVRNCHPDIVGRMHAGDARSLPFPDFPSILAFCVPQEIPEL